MILAAVFHALWYTREPPRRSSSSASRSNSNRRTRTISGEYLTLLGIVESSLIVFFVGPLATRDLAVQLCDLQMYDALIVQSLREFDASRPELVKCGFNFLPLSFVDNQQIIPLSC